MKITTLLLALPLLGLTTLSTPALAGEVSVTFYDTLSPHGDWVVVESYGRVWRPYRTVVGVDFVPYASGGHWVHSNHGWVFEQSWSWGWLPFHYGRWYLDPFNGWVWVPDTIWAPSWVEWRVGGGYIGWAPMGPRYHTNVTANFYYVENRHFVEPQIWHHRAVSVNAQVVFEATRPIAPPSGQAWAVGPQVTEVRAATRLPIPERRMEAPARPAQIFPKDMPAPAPMPPRSPGAQGARGEQVLPPPSKDLLPPPSESLKRQPEPRGQPQAPAPMKPEPMQRQPEQRDPMQDRAPMRQDPIPRQPEQRGPPPMKQEPMQRQPEQRGPPQAPAPIQQQPMQRQPDQRGQPQAPAPMQQQPMQRQPEQRAQPQAPAPQQQRAPPMQQQQQQQMPQQQPVPQQQQQENPNQKKRAQPGQPMQPGPSPGPGGPPMGPPPGRGH